MTNNRQLAEEFADFFFNKTEIIREGFKDIQPYQPRNLDTPLPNKFQP